MKCENCGTEYAEGLDVCVHCGGTIADRYAGTAPEKDGPSTGVRVLLGFLSVLLSITLIVTMLATTLILDYRQLTSQGNIQKAVGQMFAAPASCPVLRPGNAAKGLSDVLGKLESTDLPTQKTPDALSDWLLGSLQDGYGQEINAGKEQVEAFVEKSTVDDFVVDKATGYVGDFIAGTSNTTITDEELDRLIRDNADVMESEFGIEMTPAVVDKLVSHMQQLNIDRLIREDVFGGLEELTLFAEDAFLAKLFGKTGQSYTLSALMADLQVWTSNGVLAMSIGLNVMLILILLLINRLRVPKTLIGAGIPMAIVGGLLSVPTVLLQALLPAGGDGILGALTGVVRTLAGAMAPVHYTVLALGLVLIVVGAVTKKAAQNRQAPQAA